MNLYAYVESSPVMWVDPTGLNRAPVDLRDAGLTGVAARAFSKFSRRFNVGTVCVNDLGASSRGDSSTADGTTQGATELIENVVVTARDPDKDKDKNQDKPMPEDYHKEKSVWNGSLSVQEDLTRGFDIDMCAPFYFRSGRAMLLMQFLGQSKVSVRVGGSWSLFEQPSRPPRFFESRGSIWLRPSLLESVCRDLVHEASHAQHDAVRREDPQELERDAYVDARIRGEVEANAAETEAVREWGGQQNKSPVHQAFLNATDEGERYTAIADTKWSDGESTYRGFYGNAWDEANSGRR